MSSIDQAQSSDDFYNGYHAILGGSFDPVHNGHLHIASEILRLTGISRVIFIPSGKHHFKQSNITLEYPQRLALLQTVCNSYPRFEVWDIDTPVTSGYTADLLKQLYQVYPQNKFCFVLGSDNLAQLPQWHDFTWLAANVQFMIIPRPEYPCPPAILKSIRYTFLSCERSVISSTDIRRRITSQEPISGLVPPTIESTVISLYH